MTRSRESHFLQSHLCGTHCLRFGIERIRIIDDLYHLVKNQDLKMYVNCNNVEYLKQGDGH